MIRAEVMLQGTSKWRAAFRGAPEFTSVARACAALRKHCNRGAYPTGARFRVVVERPPFRTTSRKWSPE